MDLNNYGISSSCNLDAGTAGRANGNINRMESFSSYCFGSGGGIACSLPIDIPAQGQPLRHAFAQARQSPESVQPAGRFMVKDREDGRQIASLLKTTMGVRDGISCTPDYRRFLVQHQGAIFNFCLDENGAITASAMVHPASCLQQDFTRVAGQPALVFQKMEGARQILYTYLAEKADTSRSDLVTPPINGASHQDDFFPFSAPSFP